MHLIAATSSSRDKASLSDSDVDLKLFIKDVDDPHSRKRPLKLKSWSTIKDVKDHIQKLLHVPPACQRLYFGPLITAKSFLPNHWTLQDAGIYKNDETLFLEIKDRDHLKASGSGNLNSNANSISTLKSKANDICVSKLLLSHTPKELRRLIQQARRGMSMGFKPNLVLDGSGGTYFLHDARKIRVGVFKPADEEPYAENNPRGHVHMEDGNGNSCAGGMSMREGIQPGEACLREVAAYLLDHGGFADVPLTTLAEARHPAFHQNGAMLNLNQGGAAVGSHSLSQQGSSSSPQTIEKVGSFQEYVSGECCMDDLSPSKITVEEVHKIAVLDIRIMNADRNTANLICRRCPENPDFFELIPIDHGYCLRTVADVCWFDWCWLDWPQLKQPVSEKTKEYILNLDVEGEAAMLKERLNIPERALDYFRASSKLLQAGIRSGMTLYDVAILCCRNDDAGELPSKLETLMSMADDISKSAIDNGRWHHIAASKALEDQLSPDLGSRRLRKSAGAYDTGGVSNMFKSQSSMNFSSAFVLQENQNENENDDTPPTPMAQSSTSDSSSTGMEQVSVGEDECDEWAASVIGTTLEPTPERSITRRQRSISYARDDSDHPLLSCNDDSDSSHGESVSSPVGFWHVPPSKDTEEDELTWSPHISPSFRALSPDLGLNKELEIEDFQLEKNRVVKFDLGNLIPPIIHRASSIHDSDASNSNSNGPSTYAAALTPRLMKRSHSYSAFSSSTRISDEERIRSRTLSSREHREKLKHYFHKFIDLLIDREITPKVRSRQLNTDAASISKKKINVDMDMVREQLERATGTETMRG
jgi:hypothetical protein